MGLTPHPAQVAELQRLAELKRTEPAAAAAAAAANVNQSATKKTASIMPDQTREALKRVVLALRKAGVTVPDAPAEVAPPAGNSPETPAAPPVGAAPARQGSIDIPAPNRTASGLPLGPATTTERRGEAVPTAAAGTAVGATTRGRP
jgi:penicillin-binding protein 1A